MSASTRSEDHPATEQDAQQIIRDICSSRGDIDSDDEIEIAKTRPEWQAQYRRDKAVARASYANFTKLLVNLYFNNCVVFILILSLDSVADQLFTSPFGFIPEILQNADDAEYDNTPSLTFRLRPQELIIESNQKPFTIANVRAICATNESSKTRNDDSHETTGEKGIGFKSVFGIATEVRIQSGLWSFRFEHRRGQDGIGMVKPLWTDPELLPSDVSTRFSLEYHPHYDENFLAGLAEEFENLSDYILFATRRVTTLEIVFEGLAGRHHTVLFKWHSTEDGEEARITRSTGQSDQRKAVNQETIFKVHQMTVTGLPPRAVGSSPTGDGTNDKNSDIKLGFQVDEDNNPIVPELGQYTFAFLPIERLDYMPVSIPHSRSTEKPR